MNTGFYLLMKPGGFAERKGNSMPQRTDIKQVLIIGSGPIIIGQACEFDYSGTQACKALRALGYEIVLVNSNPATIMTDQLAGVGIAGNIVLLVKADFPLP